MREGYSEFYCIHRHGVFIPLGCQHDNLPKVLAPDAPANDTIDSESPSVPTLAIVMSLIPPCCVAKESEFAGGKRREGVQFHGMLQLFQPDAPDEFDVNKLCV